MFDVIHPGKATSAQVCAAHIVAARIKKKRFFIPYLYFIFTEVSEVRELKTLK